MSNIKKVLIVGGGIGGLSAAIALQKVGIETEIVEIQKEFNVYGVGVILQPNAVRAIDDLGILDKVLALGKTFYGTIVCDGPGNVIHKMSPRKAGDYDISCGISRRDMHQILYNEAIEKGAKIRLGLTVEDIVENQERVFVTFTDNTTDIYDLVIGADGVNSKVRDLMFENLKPKFVGQAVWRYPLKRPQNMPDSCVMFYGDKNKAGIVPMSEDTVYVFVVTAEPGNPWKPEDQLHVLMRESLEEFGGLMTEIKENITDPKNVIYRPLTTILVDKPWYRGRVLLIGDAAHTTVPHLANGAAISIEDGIVLADLLENDLPIQEALDQFMEKRFERCKLIVDNSNTLVEWELLKSEGKLPKENDPNVVAGLTFMRMAEAYR